MICLRAFCRLEQPSRSNKAQIKSIFCSGKKFIRSSCYIWARSRPCAKKDFVSIWLISQNLQVGKWSVGNKRVFVWNQRATIIIHFTEIREKKKKSATNMEQELIKLFEAADGDKNKALSKG